jgi:hypothetical protein
MNGGLETLEFWAQKPYDTRVWYLGSPGETALQGRLGHRESS